MAETLQRVSSSPNGGGFYEPGPRRSRQPVGGQLSVIGQPRRAVQPAVNPCEEQSSQQPTQKRR
jgi:hypothetical protein